MSEGLILVITAPSGSGKTTIYKELLGRRDDLRFSVSHTTRPPREGERDGVDYHFVTRGEFERKIREGDFLEWAEVHGDLKGTDQQAFEECRRSGKVCILDLDVQGASSIKKVFPQVVTIFIKPPDMEELRRRLEQRGTESSERIRVRLANAARELEKQDAFDYIVVNDRVDRAAREIESIIDRELRGRG